MSLAESPKSVLAPITAMSTGGGGLCGSTAGGRTVRDLARRLGFLHDEPDGPRLVAGRSARA
jgi:hypothetical protein